MAIPQKASRTLIIDEIRYRWVVSVHENTVNLVIELAKEPGQRLHAYFQCRDLYVRDENGEWQFQSQKQSIQPSHVKRVIKRALNDGWKPAEKGIKPFVLKDAARVALTIDAEVIDSRFVDSDATMAYIKEIAADFLDTYMALSLCMDFEIHDRIMNSEPGTRFPIEEKNMQKMGLTFAVYLDSFNAKNFPVIALQCNEFPDIVETFWWLC